MTNSMVDKASYHGASGAGDRDAFGHGVMPRRNGRFAKELF
jgi:hypothetical protein